MFEPARKPKRVGGAPFPPAVPFRKDALPHASISPRRPHATASMAGTAPASARGARSGAAASEGGRGDARCRSEDGRSAVTPCTKLAQRHVQELVGVDAVSSRGHHVRADIDAARHWTLVEEMGTAEYYVREQRKRNEARSQRQKNSRDLQEQQNLRLQEKQEQRDEAKKWREILETDVAKWRREEEEKKATALDSERRFNDERREQLERTRESQRQQRQADAQADEEMLQANLDAKRRQEEKDFKHRQQQKEAALELQRRAHVARLEREQARVAEAKNDVELARSQQELLDKHERERSEFFVQLRDKQMKLLDAYQSGVGNELERLERQDEERAERHQKARDEKEQREREEREIRKKARIKHGLSALNNQVAEREEERRRRVLDEKTVYETQCREAELLNARDRQTREQHRHAREQNAQFLREQIQERAARTPAALSRDQMDEVEKRMNRNLLERAMDSSRSDGMQMLLKQKRSEYHKVVVPN
eukprot:TRINITY_DN57108_c0_g1_i1.p1 TRINITY_DN57108_c0_g1~~TRINITY_DN57108_c0_g1_i1.p1  ORF type:complete len:484 (+),score=112.52 TRINITY_DN57108_c0_g1_i1:176-1627(+)